MDFEFYFHLIVYQYKQIRYHLLQWLLFKHTKDKAQKHTHDVLGHSLVILSHSVRTRR